MGIGHFIAAIGMATMILAMVLGTHIVLDFGLLIGAFGLNFQLILEIRKLEKMNHLLKRENAHL